jgi:hypothetical protein
VTVDSGVAEGRESRGGPDRISLGHQFGPVRKGPILPPRPLESVPTRPTDSRAVHLVGTAAPPRSETECAELVRRAGWALESVRPGPDGRTHVVAERDVRMDLSALRRNRLVLAVCTAEYVAAIVLGFVWPDLGFPGWEGDVLIGLGVVGAAGFVWFLPRVEFRSEIAVVRMLPPDPSATTPGPGPSAPVLPVYEVWAAEARTRNWEVLGDRGGRRVLAARGSGACDAAADRLAGVFAAGDSAMGRPNPPDGFK